MNNAKYSSISCIGYKLSFFSRNYFYLDMDSDLKLSVARLSVNRLDLAQQVILDNILSIHPSLVLDINFFFRNYFYLDMDSDLKLSVAHLSVNRLDLAQPVILDNILSLLNGRTGVSKIENFILNQVNTLINYLSTA